MATFSINAFRRRLSNRKRNLENGLYFATNRILKKVFIDFAKSVRSGNNKLPTEKQIEKLLKGGLVGKIRNIVRMGIYYGLKDVEELYGRELPIFVEKELTLDDIDELGLGSTLNVIAAEGLVEVVTVSTATVSKMKSVFEKAIEQGLKQDDIADLLVQEAEAGYPKWKAKRIAQTETTRAFNAGTLKGYQKSTVVGKKHWVPYVTSGHRETHSGVASVPVNERFTVGSSQLMYPGDPEGQPEDVVNCVPGNTNVFSFANVEKAMKRWYDGELVTIRTSTGCELTASPNHPVFTLDGWMSIKSLVKGSNIVCCFLTEKMPFSNPNIDNSPSSIDKVFSSFSMQPQRIVGLDMDFHGDGKASNVDVVFANSLLESTGDASTFHPTFEKGFSPTLSSARTLQSFGSFAKITGASFHPPNSTVGFVSNELSVFGGGISKSVAGSAAAISDSNVCIDESTSDCASVNIQSFCNRLLGFSRGITVDNIVDVKVQSFHGFLYNLETGNGWYIANDNNITNHTYNVKGIITHNCKCGMMPEITIERAT